MKKWILLFLLIPSVCWCAVNEKYSYKDFMHQSFKDIKAEEFNNSTVAGSCFYQENKPGEDIFPDGLINVTFKKCNLDNVKIKKGMIVDETNTAKKLQAQNDLEDWIVEKKVDKWEAKEPLNKDTFIKLGLSIDPKSISAIKLTKPITEENK